MREGPTVFTSSIITNEQVKKHMTLERVIECVENTWRWHGEGEVIMPPKITTDMAALGVESWFNSMPSYIRPLDSAGIKIVGGYTENTRNGLPYIRSNVLLLDPHNGSLRALVCGDWISDARTGAQPAIAMDLLASATNVVTIIGAGTQAHFAAACILKRHALKELRICDIKQAAREKFARDFADAPCRVVPYDSSEEACRGADVIITLTTANAPLVYEGWCKKGCLVLTMGSYTETADDVPAKFDKIFLDCVSQGLHRGNLKEMAEKGIVSEASIEAELPDILAGKKQGRTDPDDRILCELVGMGSPDLCVATEAYRKILEAGEEVLTVDMMGAQQG